MKCRARLTIIFRSARLKILHVNLVPFFFAIHFTIVPGFVIKNRDDMQLFVQLLATTFVGSRWIAKLRGLGVSYWFTPTVDAISCKKCLVALAKKLWPKINIIYITSKVPRLCLNYKNHKANKLFMKNCMK